MVQPKLTPLSLSSMRRVGNHWLQKEERAVREWFKMGQVDGPLDHYMRLNVDATGTEASCERDVTTLLRYGGPGSHRTGPGLTLRGAVRHAQPRPATPSGLPSWAALHIDSQDKVRLC